MRSQFIVVHRRAPEPLCLQIVRQLADAIRTGMLPPGAPLPSSRALASTLHVSRNTVLAAYDELGARGLIRSRRGAGMYVAAAAGVQAFDLRRVLREAHYPFRMIGLQDPDGNSLYLRWD